jgi:hypothetical protein
MGLAASAGQKYVVVREGAGTGVKMYAPIRKLASTLDSRPIAANRLSQSSNPFTYALLKS